MLDANKLHSVFQFFVWDKSSHSVTEHWPEIEMKKYHVNDGGLQDSHLNATLMSPVESGRVVSISGSNHIFHFCKGHMQFHSNPLRADRLHLLSAFFSCHVVLIRLFLWGAKQAWQQANTHPTHSNIKLLLGKKDGFGCSSVFLWWWERCGASKQQQQQLGCCWRADGTAAHCVLSNSATDC